LGVVSRTPAISVQKQRFYEKKAKPALSNEKSSLQDTAILVRHSSKRRRIAFCLFIFAFLLQPVVSVVESSPLASAVGRPLWEAELLGKAGHQGRTDSPSFKAWVEAHPTNFLTLSAP